MYLSLARLVRARGWRPEIRPGVARVGGSNAGDFSKGFEVRDNYNKEQKPKAQKILFFFKEFFI